MNPVREKLEKQIEFNKNAIIKLEIYNNSLRAQLDILDKLEREIKNESKSMIR